MNGHVTLVFSRTGLTESGNCDCNWNCNYDSDCGWWPWPWTGSPLPRLGLRQPGFSFPAWRIQNQVHGCPRHPYPCFILTKPNSTSSYTGTSEIVLLRWKPCFELNSDVTATLRLRSYKRTLSLISQITSCLIELWYSHSICTQSLESRPQSMHKLNTSQKSHDLNMVHGMQLKE